MVKVTGPQILTGAGRGSNVQVTVRLFELDVQRNPIRNLHGLFSARSRMDTLIELESAKPDGAVVITWGVSVSIGRQGPLDDVAHALMVDIIIRIRFRNKPAELLDGLGGFGFLEAGTLVLPPAVDGKRLLKFMITSGGFCTLSQKKPNCTTMSAWPR